MENGKKQRDVKISQTQVVGMKIIFSSVFMGISLLFDIFAMVRYSHLLWLICIFSLVFVAAVYFFSSSIMQLRYIKQSQEEEMFNDLFKSSKATYLMMKKYFDEIQEQLDDMEEKMGVPVEEILNAQKSIAKIEISRSKENADALMNSNDKLLEKIFDFEDLLRSLEERMVQTQKAVAEEGNQDLLIKQQELSNLIKELELSIKKEILTIHTKISSQPVMMAAPQMMVPPSYTPEQTMTSTPTPPTETFNEIPNDVLDEMVQKADEQLNFDLGDFEEDTLGEVIDFESGIPSFDNMEEPIIGEEFMVGEEPIVEEEPVVEEEPIIEEESVMEEEPIIEEELVMEEEPIIEEEPVVEEEPIIEEEPVMEEEPIVEEEPVAEEKPPMPDLSDPNHVMTPEEIQALLANM